MILTKYRNVKSDKTTSTHINNSTIVSVNPEKRKFLWSSSLSTSSLQLLLLKSLQLLKGIKWFWSYQRRGKARFFFSSQSHVLVLYQVLVLAVYPPSTLLTSYKSLLQTWQRLTRERSWPPFRVSCCGGAPNSCRGSTVVSQKLYLLAK